MKYYIKIALVLLVGAVVCGCAGPRPTNHEVAFQQWLRGVRSDAIYQGVSPKTVDHAFGQIHYREDVIALDQKQPDKTKTFDEYIAVVLPQSRLDKARAMYQENKKLADSVGRKYSVQPQYIIALWGIESNFGSNMGKFPVIESLATLAYEGRRQEFFKSELIAALKILDQGHISYENMKGSWAGAMGQTQFMPTSFFSYAQDYNYDGHKDIWNTKEDAFASIANYLSELKWDNVRGWGVQVTLPKGVEMRDIGLDQPRTVGEWKSAGVKTVSGADFPGNDNNQAWIVIPDKAVGPDNKAFLVFSNYKAIMKWNRSTYFATAVGMLADAIVAN